MCDTGERTTCSPAGRCPPVVARRKVTAGEYAAAISGLAIPARFSPPALCHHVRSKEQAGSIRLERANLHHRSSLKLGYYRWLMYCLAAEVGIFYQK
jgi:hypothetical protein